MAAIVHKMTLILPIAISEDITFRNLQLYMFHMIPVDCKAMKGTKIQTVICCMNTTACSMKNHPLKIKIN